jgi:hypothetical protein
MQSPSFLAHQRDMQRQRGQHNVQSLFGVERIPSDSQLRNLLDPVDPAGLRTPFWEIYAQLEAAGHLAAYTGVGGNPPDLAGRVAVLQFREGTLPELSCISNWTCRPRLPRVKLTWTG